MRDKSKYYGYGVLMTILGGAGLAENITSGRGSFLASAVVFAFGFAMVLWSYTNDK